MERRKHLRRPLDELAARIYWVKDQEKTELDYFPANVSKDGLSMMLSHPLPVGSKLCILLDAGEIELNVVWCKASPDDPAVFRIGSTLVDTASYNLEDLIKQELSA